MKTLVIAEKPSVMRDLAKALTAKYGRFSTHEVYMESKDFVITSAVGHLLEMSVSKEDFKGKFWTLDKLPQIPKEFVYKPREGVADRLKAIKKLFQRDDIASVINACDAGREGELIFKTLYHYVGSKLPVRRLWLQSMTPKAILEGFENLKTDEEVKGLEAAAYGRQEADWLVGINGSRAMSAIGRGLSIQKASTLSVGRVQTPTLKMLVDRELQIQGHIQRPYWKLVAWFSTKEGSYEGSYVDLEFKPSQDTELKADRIFDKSLADKVYQDASTSKDFKVVSNDRTLETKNSPMLFDLTSLQKECNSRFGLKADDTLAIAQSLYEKEKAITYPRTASKHLPEDYVGVIHKLLDSLKSFEPVKSFVEECKGYVKKTPKIFNDSQVSDHFAIIPTGEIPSHLPELHRKVYELIVRRTLAAFFPAAETYVVTRLTKSSNGLHFKSIGRSVKNPGWMKVYRQKTEDSILPHVEIGDSVEKESLTLEEKFTNPPSAYTDASLLGMMEHAGKDLDDKEQKEAIKGKGLGTPATRAGIIKALVEKGYANREGKEIRASQRGIELITLLDKLKLSMLTSAKTTADWEHQLHLVEMKVKTLEDFKQGIAKLVQDMVNILRDKSQDNYLNHTEALEGVCKCCGGKLTLSSFKVSCTNCQAGFKPAIMGVRLNKEQIESLLRGEVLMGLESFSSRLNKKFTLRPVSLVVEDKTMVLQVEAYAPKVDLSNAKSVGDCPLCKKKVYDTPARYQCSGCRFSIPKEICKKTLEEDVIQSLMKAKTTRLVEGFTSKAGKVFSAKLSIDKRKASVVFKFDQHK